MPKPIHVERHYFLLLAWDIMKLLKCYWLMGQMSTLIEYGASLSTKGSNGYSPIEQVMGNETMNSFKLITFLQFHSK